jgi:histone acetyltransferase (RNA polymerase elongator complex component)
MKHSNVAIFVPHLGCPHDCSFCNQRSIVGLVLAPTPQDIDKTLREALPFIQERDAEIAFFGGSFTGIEQKYMVSLLEATREFIGHFKGIRISTRPDYIDESILDLLLDYHITTIELGVQSMNDAVLMLNNRGHSSSDVIKSAQKIHAKGIKLGLQMMVGLYGDSEEGAFDTAQKIAGLKPDMVRIYPTLVIRGTKLEELYHSGNYEPPSLEETVKICKKLLLFFEGQDIPVIRLGLHSSEGLAEGLIAGPWHPAFRELVESRIYLENAEKVLSKLTINQIKPTLYVQKTAISKMIGQNRENIKALKDRFEIDFKAVGDEDLNKYEVVIKY